MDEYYFDELGTDKLIGMAQVHIDELKRLGNLLPGTKVDCQFNSGEDPKHLDCVCGGAKEFTKEQAVAIIEDSLERLGE